MLERFGKIFETDFHVVPPDEVDDMAIRDLDAKDARERKITALIKHVFAQLGFRDVMEVSYDEQPERAAVVLIDTPPDGIPLSVLDKLHQSHLGEEFLIHGHQSALCIEIAFRVPHQLDTAQPIVT